MNVPTNAAVSLPGWERSARPPHVVYLTAGAAGMFCGSCMRDNTLSAALTRLGVNLQLVPTYTPLRTDEESVATDDVFFGGINIYLQQKYSLFRYLPGWADRWLDRPWLLNLVSGRGVQIDMKFLGQLTVSMLQGTHGVQRKETRRLIEWLRRDMPVDLINFTNMLIAGCAPELKRELGIPLVATLQGDDIFVESLPEPYRGQVMQLVRELVPSIDAFVVFSEFYRDFMADYWSIPRDRIQLVPLGLETRDFAGVERGQRPPGPWRIGYLARLAPEKGLHIAVRAFIELRRRWPDLPAELHVAGWMSPSQESYAQQLWEEMSAAGCRDQLVLHGEVDRSGKVDFLRQIDLLSVPTTYREPKGLFVAEAWAAGVPVVQPAHGAFPELIQATGGGRLVPPHDPIALAETWAELFAHPTQLVELGQLGRRGVTERLSATAAAQATWDVYRRLIRPA